MKLSKLIESLNTILDSNGDKEVLSMYTEDGVAMIIDSWVIDEITLSAENEDEIHAYCIMRVNEFEYPEETPSRHLRLLDTIEDSDAKPT
jgi:hypothetical protein